MDIHSSRLLSSIESGSVANLIRAIAKLLLFFPFYALADVLHLIWQRKSIFDLALASEIVHADGRPYHQPLTTSQKWWCSLGAVIMMGLFPLILVIIIIGSLVIQDSELRSFSSRSCLSYGLAKARD